LQKKRQIIQAHGRNILQTGQYTPNSDSGQLSFETHRAGGLRYPVFSFDFLDLEAVVMGDFNSEKANIE
jgi:hypothetical protein